MSSTIIINIEYSSTFSFAAQQNSYPLFHRLSVDYSSQDNITDNDTPSLKNLKLCLKSDSIIDDQEWIIDEIQYEQIITLPIKSINIDTNKLLELTEEILVPIRFELIKNDKTKSKLTRKDIEISILPLNYWGGENRQPDLLAAFVKPNGVYVESLVRSVTTLLAEGGYGRSADGYQSLNREKPYMMAAFLWNVIFAEKLSYVNPPQGFARIGQRIRLASDISTSKISACLDTSLLFASCLELMGLNPIVALSKEHAFVGVWLIDNTFPFLTNDDPMDLRKRVDSKDLLLFESTLVTNDTPITFEQTREYARDLISEDKESNFVYVIDIKQARSRKIKPISTLEKRIDETNSANLATVLLPPIAPVLPPVRANEQNITETPETRIGSWQRKLLDLTKRNPLLSLNERALSIPLYCPDIAAMEDMLAAGKIFTFVAAESSPANDRERSRDLFRLQTGSEIHKTFASEQLNLDRLIANLSDKKLSANATSLFRKAKNDLTEGGANTLFLALGMLRWKEHPEDSRSYRAPLILIPVTLTRKSAGAKVKLNQLTDETPIFNTTLIEFLSSEYSIDLNRYRETLPADHSGVDVSLIWNTVRNAVSEQKGFEVVEELVLSTFSFAKYLMWKDLKDRNADLKKNPFVKHLIDQPQDAYIQVTSFLHSDEVDEKVDPLKVLTPLNCDSFQLAAVEASAKPQDFVLEGPPGTGKSETIANIISYNLSLGRKVLFVAEKKAALDVVYKRMEKVGLDHLCLDLHSNKANKKAVLEQLQSSTYTHGIAIQADWATKVKELKVRKAALNSYVKALNQKTKYGVSTREAIARCSKFGKTHNYQIAWQWGLNNCPIQSEENLKAMLNTIKQTGLAYDDVSTLDPSRLRAINARQWSNGWQHQIVNCLEEYKNAIKELMPSTISFSSSLGISIDNNALQDAYNSLYLVKLINSFDSAPFAFLFEKNAPQRLAAIDDLSAKKLNFDRSLATTNTNVSAEMLGNSPVFDWKSIYDASKGSWFKTHLAKYKVNKQAILLGYEKFNDLSVVEELEKTAHIQASMMPLIAAINSDMIWQGWDTKPEHLSDISKKAKIALQALTKTLELTNDPQKLLIKLHAELIDGRDSNSHSMLMQKRNDFIKKWHRFTIIEKEAKALGLLSFNKNTSSTAIVSFIDNLLKYTSKFKPWVEWTAAKEQLNKFKLQSLAQALESKKILSNNIEAEVFTAYCKWLAPQLIDQNDHLRSFKASSHEAFLTEYRALDAEIASHTGRVIASMAAKNAPNLNSKDCPKELGVLPREFQKKSRHKPIRSLFQETGESILNLTPCMMMSPLSVAQFLPTDFNGFDLVVFDEASQVTTWDAAGAIARGKNVIVVGDPKQMPPTNFFTKASNTQDNNYDDASEDEDLESILDQALSARLPHLRLNGHYRSKHETLIAFSNSKYYQNSLITYPSSDTKESAVSIKRVEGVYTKGKERNNPIEAKAVVDELVSRLLTLKGELSKSFGIVTLNTQQQQIILDLLDDARRKQPEIEIYFNSTNTYDEVFVKNLESVQGDERDVIFLSLGYGPTEVNAPTMSMNFGPLNRTGGERRLNVAITRATTEVIIFTSFDASMIDLSRTSATAVEHLKHYLEFAERGPVTLSQQATADHGVDQFDSDFEESVAWALRGKGWKVQTQVGVSKFRIDLGIIHPNKPGKYLAGVECDGATYHSSPAARDRDRIRHEVLESLGWNLVRLWSTDYFQDSENAIEKIHQKLLLLIKKEQNKEPISRTN